MSKAKTRIAIPAIRLPDGEILQGEPHAVLLLRAIGRGFRAGLVGGFLDKMDKFRPVNPTADDLFPRILPSESEALKRADSAAWRDIEGAELQLAAGREDSEFIKIYLDRFYSLGKLPIRTAMRCKRTKQIFSGTKIHPALNAYHPQVDLYEAGWLHEDGRFLTMEQTGGFIKGATGYCIQENRPLSGEEFLPRLDSKADAVHLGSHLHKHGHHHIKLRIHIFEERGIHLNHVELLKITNKEYLKCLKNQMDGYGAE